MINLPEFDLYIFDLDDTLINTRQAYYSAQAAAVLRVYPEFSGDTLDRHLQDLKWLCRIFGSGQPENYFRAFSQNLSGVSTSAASAVESLLTVYHECFNTALKPNAGAVDYLNQLTDSAKPLALVSNGKTAVQLNKLRLTGLNPFFPEPSCFISEMVLPTQKKPSPHLVEMACQKAGISPDRAIFFGNIPADILAGNLAGVTTALYGKDTDLMKEMPGIAQPDFQISSWE